MITTIRRSWLPKPSLIVGMVIATLVGSLLLSSITFAAEPANRSDWRYTKSIELQGSGKYVALFLDEEVYKGAREDLGDLRIVNDKGQFVPYYVDSGAAKAADKQVVYPSNLINTGKSNKDTFIDFRIVAQDVTKDIQGNRVALSLPEQAFLKHLELYGSYDGNQWELLHKDYVYRTEQLEKNTVVLDKTVKFAYYRVKIIDNVENLVFPQLQLIHYTRETSWQEFAKTTSLPYDTKQDHGQTLLSIRNDNRLRITAIQLEAQGSFRRSYTVQTAEGQDIAIKGKRELYRLDFKDVQLQNTTIIGADPITNPVFTIKINNQDNAPILLTGLKIDYVIDKVVFERQEGRTYQLMYGNSSASKPSYDIASFRTQIEQENPVLAKLAAQVEAPGAANADTAGPSWFQSKTAFNFIIIAVSVLLAVILGMKLSRSKRS
ncbi:Protein of unknown function [Paenibacillus sp. 1_12]|uniref:DUF3999 family protein n=1 Tax=Paenibacillus sp. 1_12 TaxID=1566278 RepID=UPI0008F382DC|nr:DUF3999 family protein [Paenibacillus sp. 1_12]SFL94963.1 Protein of unknown function [Paenibacillus sp. 1_12]